MKRRTFLAGALAAPVAASAVSGPARPARAAAWPSAGPIRLVVASAAGGNADVVARIVAAELEPALGQSIVVENLPAASGMRATETVSRAAPDGYTLLVGTSSQLVHNIALFDPLPVDITATLKGVAMMNEVPMILCVRNEEPAQSLPAFVERLKAEPGANQYGSGPVGTTTHITGALFLSRIGAQVEHVPYQASSQAMRDLIAGRLAFVFDPSLTGVAQVKGGAVRTFGVAAPQRLAAIPDVPTLAEAGLPEFVSQTWNTVSAPAGTPPEIVERLNGLVNRVVQSAAVKGRLEELGSIVPAAMTPAQVDAYYAGQREIWIPVVRATGARAG
jgi:tripartite-type tricarboxylate transporter receptor subunit TctC